MYQNDKPLFITIEGGEGSGKSGVINIIAKFLNDNNIENIMTREPGGTNISEQIRAVILNQKNTEMDAWTEAMLYAASRRQHIVEKVKPALAENKVVVSDRYIDSNLAYQGHARGLGVDKVIELNKFAIDSLWPDLTIYLDVIPEEGMKRIDVNKNREVNRLDVEKISFHHTVREGYHNLIKNNDRMVLVDTNGKTELEVQNEVLEVIKKHLTKKDQ